MRLQLPIAKNRRQLAPSRHAHKTKPKATYQQKQSMFTQKDRVELEEIMDCNRPIESSVVPRWQRKALMSAKNDVPSPSVAGGKNGAKSAATPSRVRELLHHNRVLRVLTYAHTHTHTHVMFLFAGLPVHPVAGGNGLGCRTVCPDVVGVGRDVRCRGW